jgi:Reverse transcriptase-like
LRVLNIAIDADGSPSGYISWHNHFNNKSKIRSLRPSLKNEKFGVQRMEMLAIFFAISDNIKAFKKLKRTRQIVIIRSDSSSTIEQLNNKAQIKDRIIQRIFESIKRMLGKISYTIVFDHLKRTKNKAGKILENIFRKNIQYLKKKRPYKNRIKKQYIVFRDGEYSLGNSIIFTDPLKLVMTI